MPVMLMLIAMQCPKHQVLLNTCFSCVCLLVFCDKEYTENKLYLQAVLPRWWGGGGGGGWGQQPWVCKEPTALCEHTSFVTPG